MTPAQLLERITQGEWWEENRAVKCTANLRDNVAYLVPAVRGENDRDSAANALAISLLPDLLRLHVAAEEILPMVKTYVENADPVERPDYQNDLDRLTEALAALSDKMKGMK